MLEAQPIIVVEDDPDLRCDLVDYLTLKALPACGAATAQQLWTLTATAPPQLVLLDIGLPDASGLDLARQLRRRHPQVGIVMLTAFGDDGTRVEGLEGGADAYLVKGVSLEVIEATCRSVMRRLKQQAGVPQDAPAPAMPRVDSSDLWRLSVERCLLSLGDGQASLTLTEVSFLQRLMQTPGVVVSRSDLLAHMGKTDSLNHLRNLDGCAARLRRKIDQELAQALPLRSHYGQGYVFTGPCQLA